MFGIGQNNTDKELAGAKTEIADLKLRLETNYEAYEQQFCALKNLILCISQGMEEDTVELDLNSLASFMFALSCYEIYNGNKQGHRKALDAAMKLLSNMSLTERDDYMRQYPPIQGIVIPEHG
jgi:hypothetical protein